jgi:hypothetical protein
MMNTTELEREYENDARPDSDKPELDSAPLRISVLDGLKEMMV